MKRFKIFMLVFMLVLFTLSLLPQTVFADTYSVNHFMNYSNGWYKVYCDSSGPNIQINSGISGGAWYYGPDVSGTSGSITYELYDSQGSLIASESPARLVYSPSADACGYSSMLFYGKSLVNGSSYSVSISGSGTFSTDAGSNSNFLNFNINESFSFTFQGGSTVYTNDTTPSVSGSLNEYDCTSNIATFNISANFDLQSLSVDGLDTSGMTHILNSSFDSASAILTVYFDNTLGAGSHFLLLSGSGFLNGSDVSAQGHIDFTFDCTVPPVPEGTFKIIAPADGQQFNIPDGDSGITTDLTAVYQGTNGGTDGDMTQYSCNFLVQDANLNDYFPEGGGLGNIAGTYDSSLNRTTWTASYQFPAGNYTFTAKMLSSPMLTDSISFDVLGAEGDITNNPFAPLINWLKKWFVKVMEYLFVPTQQQIQSLLPSSPVGDYNLNPFSSSMFPSPLYSVDFPITSTHSLTLSIDSVPSSLITAFRAFSQIFISLALLIFLIKGV